MDHSPAHILMTYVCPACKGSLHHTGQALSCPACKQEYPLVGGIPDFVAPTLETGGGSLTLRMDQADRCYLKTLSGLYESRLWYSLVISMFLGRNATSLADLDRKIKSALDPNASAVLDAACGTATYSRRVASPARRVYGIDISLAMLQRGAAYLQEERTPGVHLARAQVEHLPFSDDFFDFAICSGALHLFPDTIMALKEMGRTLKPGARLVGLTFLVGRQGLVRYEWFRRRLKQRGTVRLFHLPELESHFHQAGLAWLPPQFLGSGVFFTAEKQGPNR